MEKLEVAMESFRILAKHDCCDDVFWRCDGDYAPLTVLILCNDVFEWGAADAEEITEQNIGMLASAYEDANGAGELGVIYGSMLFCARSRRERPQGACYPDSVPELWPLLDACGPEREIGFLNPCRPGQYKPRRLDEIHKERIAALEARVSELEHDIERHIAITSNEANARVEAETRIATLEATPRVLDLVAMNKLADQSFDARDHDASGDDACVYCLTASRLNEIGSIINEWKRLRAALKG